MPGMRFAEKLQQAAGNNRSLVCVGLDPDPQLMPSMGILEFNKAIIDATADLVCAYKPNLAFYEAQGIEGINALIDTVKYIPASVPVIGDGKRGDIGNTARLYARAMYEVFGFDAVTLNPYLGYDSIEPFISYEDKGIFLLCRTSNVGAMDFQSLNLWSERADCRQQPLYSLVARRAQEWNKHDNIGLVLGATYPQELKEIRELCPGMTFLIPGVGAQGASLEATVKYGLDVEGGGAIINSSRQVLYASRGDDFAPAARKAAQALRDQINALRQAG